VSFELEDLIIETKLTETNLLPVGFRKYAFNWCGAGTFVQIHFKRAGGIKCTRVYEDCTEFINKARGVEESLAFLASI
jgi:hypothetical protein